MSERKISNVAQTSVEFFIDMLKNPRNERKSDKKAEEESSSY